MASKSNRRILSVEDFVTSSGRYNRNDRNSAGRLRRTFCYLASVGVVEDAQVQRSCVQVDAGVESVLSGVVSHVGFSVSGGI
jgi:hypothetical protein